jgi:hypothetical protein
VGRENLSVGCGRGVIHKVLRIMHNTFRERHLASHSLLLLSSLLFPPSSPSPFSCNPYVLPASPVPTASCSAPPTYNAPTIALEAILLGQTCADVYVSGMAAAVGNALVFAHGCLYRYELRGMTYGA